MSDGQGTTYAKGTRAGGILLTAFREGRTEEIRWTDITLDGLVITVASDAMKATLNDVTGVRLPVSYQEAITIGTELECISPTQKICDAMFQQAKAQLSAVALVQTAADARYITMVDFVLRFHEKVEAQLKGLSCSAGDLVFGAWKLWLLHPRLVERGAVNYGFWDKSRKPPKVIQTPGGQHDAQHYDYSQLFVPVRRMARKADTGDEVDLLDHIGTQDKVPAKFLEPYRARR